MLAPMAVSTENLHSPNPPNRETRIPQYKLKANQNLILHLYREILRTLSFSMWWISGA